MSKNEAIQTELEDILNKNIMSKFKEVTLGDLKPGDKFKFMLDDFEYSVLNDTRMHDCRYGVNHTYMQIKREDGRLMVFNGNAKVFAKQNWGWMKRKDAPEQGEYIRKGDVLHSVLNTPLDRASPDDDVFVFRNTDDADDYSRLAKHSMRMNAELDRMLKD